MLIFQFKKIENRANVTYTTHKYTISIWWLQHPSTFGRGVKIRAKDQNLHFPLLYEILICGYHTTFKKRWYRNEDGLLFLYAWRIEALTMAGIALLVVNPMYTLQASHVCCCCCHKGNTRRSTRTTTYTMPFEDTRNFRTQKRNTYRLTSLKFYYYDKKPIFTILTSNNIRSSHVHCPIGRL